MRPASAIQFSDLVPRNEVGAEDCVTATLSGSFLALRRPKSSSLQATREGRFAHTHEKFAPALLADDSCSYLDHS